MIAFIFQQSTLLELWTMSKPQQEVIKLNKQGGQRPELSRDGEKLSTQLKKKKKDKIIQNAILGDWLNTGIGGEKDNFVDVITSTSNQESKMMKEK